VNPIVACLPSVSTNGRLTAHLVAQTACGAIIITGSADSFRG
jgi:hypothetical protein